MHTALQVVDQIFLLSKIPKSKIPEIHAVMHIHSKDVATLELVLWSWKTRARISRQELAWETVTKSIRYYFDQKQHSR